MVWNRVLTVLMGFWCSVRGVGAPEIIPVLGLLPEELGVRRDGCGLRAEHALCKLVKLQ